MKTHRDESFRLVATTLVAAAGSIAAFTLGETTEAPLFTGQRPLLFFIGTALAAVVIWSAGRMTGRRVTLDVRGRTGAAAAGRPLVDPARAVLNQIAHTAVDAVNDAVVAVAADLRIVYLNASAERLFQTRRQEATGRTCGEAGLQRIQDSGLPVCGSGSCTARQVIDSGRPAEGKAVFRRSDGSRVHTTYQAHPVLDPAGRPAGAVLSFQDLTQRRAYEKLRRDLLAVVSHELLTPLTSITGAVGLLHAWLEKDGRPDELEMLAMCRRSAEEMRSLIQNSLDLSEMESGQGTLKRAPSDVGRELEIAIEEIDPLAQRREVSVRLQRESSLPLVSLDPRRFRQAMHCLLRNGVQFSPPGGVVTVRAAMVPDSYLAHVAGKGPLEVEISVADQGPGLPAEDREWVFELLTQVDSSAGRAHGGMGIGLAMARAIVEKHGGRIWIQDGRGPGTEFRLRLPTLEWKAL